MPITSGYALFVLLAMGHFMGDFGLQSDRMGMEKCAGRDETLPWPWWLTAHAGIHGFLVALLTGLPVLGMAEWLAHALIDHLKCRGLFGLGTDQFLHLFCKMVWVLIACRWLGLALV
jgi:hypothetical protein